MSTLVAQPTGALAVPDFLKTVHGNAGLENVSKEDLILPRLALCQSSNDERKKSKDKYIEGLADGDFFNSVTQQIYGPKVQLIPLSFSKMRIYFKPPVGSGVILCRSMDGIKGGKLHPESCETCEFSKYDEENQKPPACTKFANFPILLLPGAEGGNVELLLFSMKSTALTEAKRWTSKMKAINKPAYSSVYSVISKEQSRPKGTFFGPIVAREGFVTNEELYRMAETQFNELQGKTIAVEEDHDDVAETDEEQPF